MTFDEIDIQSFLSIDSAHIGFSSSGIMPIIGINKDTDTANNNRAGKSSISDAFMWGLYERTMRGVKGKYVKNRYSDKKLRVQTWCHDEEHSYYIDRTAGKVELYVDNSKDSFAKTKPNTEDKISSILPSIELFCTMLYIGDDSAKFSGYNASSKMSLIEELIDLSVYDEARSVVKLKLSKLSDKERGYELELNKLCGSLQAIQDTILSLTDKMVNADDNSGTNKERMKELEEELAVLEGLDFGTVDDDHLKVSADLKELNNTIRDLNSDIKHSNRGLKDVKREREEFLELGNTCPTCKQDISDIVTENLIKEVDSKVNELGEVIAALEEELLDLEETQVKVGEANDEILTSLKKRDDKKEITRVLSTMESICYVDLDPVVKSIAEEKARLADIKKDKNRILKEIDGITESMGYYKFWEKGFSPSGIRSYKLDGIIRLINKNIRKYSSVMFGEDIPVYLDSEKDLKGGGKKNEITIMVDYGGGGYDFLSKSEKAIVNLSISLASRDVAEEVSGTKFNIIMLDEVFNGMDSKAIESSISVLEEFSKKFGVYIASHKSDIQNLGFNPIFVTKENNISTVTFSE